ncbi:MAG: acyl-CoA dehydrogenase [Actinobacteria bacterium]|nr:acyl-CoA dehydrogenase [Actinomycetota bacterium]
MDAETYVGRCRELAGVLGEHAVEGEQERRVADGAMAAVEAADVLRVIVPTALGGHGLGLDALCEGTRELAQGCPASAWTISFLQLHAWMLSRFPAEAHGDLFGGGRVPTSAAPLAPTGSLAVVDGGFEVTGRWEWATAVQHSDWCMVHGFDESVEFGTRFAVLPVADLTVEDVWHTSGMRATGSNTVWADRVFVPTERTVPGDDLRGTASGVEGDALSGLPLLSVLALVASAPAVGAAQAAVGHFHDRVSERVLAYTLGDRAADQPMAQARLASVTSDLASTLAGWRAIIDELRTTAAAGPPDEQLRVRVRLAAASAVRSARRIIGDIGEGSGASVYMSGHPLQRLQRDVETLKGHVIFDWDRTTELAGRVLLGQPLGPVDMA